MKGLPECLYPEFIVPGESPLFSIKSATEMTLYECEKIAGSLHWMK